MKRIKQTERCNMCEVRLKDRRIRVYRFDDGTWGVSFVRPTKPCAGCEDNHDAEHRMYTDKRKRVLRTSLAMSGEAMIGFMDAVATLLEFEHGGIEVR